MRKNINLRTNEKKKTVTTNLLVYMKIKRKIIHKNLNKYFVLRHHIDELFFEEEAKSGQCRTSNFVLFRNKNLATGTSCIIPIFFCMIFS